MNLHHAKAYQQFTWTVTLSRNLKCLKTYSCMFTRYITWDSRITSQHADFECYASSCTYIYIFLVFQSSIMTRACWWILSYVLWNLIWPKEITPNEVLDLIMFYCIFIIFPFQYEAKIPSIVPFCFFAPLKMTEPNASHNLGIFFVLMSFDVYRVLVCCSKEYLVLPQVQLHQCKSVLEPINFFPSDFTFYLLGPYLLHLRRDCFMN